MLIKESVAEVQTSTGAMQILIVHPVIPGYPSAKFPGVVVHSEIYQVSGPVVRYAQDIAAQGYICACPASYHEFIGPEAIAYDDKGTDLGNALKVKKQLSAYDEDAKLTIDYLCSLETCNGKIGATGMCLGGHLALRTAFDPRVKAAFCFFATDIHSETLGVRQHDSQKTMDNFPKIKGEVTLVFGSADNHVPAEGRTLVRQRLLEAKVKYTLLEIHGAEHAFIRDELSKGRYDAAITQACFGFEMELFNRLLRTDLGESVAIAESTDITC